MPARLFSQLCDAVAKARLSKAGGHTALPEQLATHEDRRHPVLAGRRTPVRTALDNETPLPRRIELYGRANGSLRLVMDAGSVRPVEVAVIRAHLSTRLNSEVYAGFSELNPGYGSPSGFLFRPYTGCRPVFVTQFGLEGVGGLESDQLLLPAQAFVQLAVHLRAVANTGQDQASIRLKLDRSFCAAVDTTD